MSIDNHRKRMCETCAFRSKSVEMNLPDQKDDLLMGCLTKVFYCHETMFQENPDQPKWLGSFDVQKKRDGTPAKKGDHQICAGYALLYGEDVGIDAKGIPIEDHAILNREIARLNTNHNED